VPKIGDSKAVKVGDTAIAIGNPGGNVCPWTVTNGIISAVDREVTIEGSRAIVDLTMMQTDAQVNPGNSGGPLCNDRGEVIGIVTRKLTDYEGIGMAIPINGAMELVNAFLDTGSAAHVISSVSKVRLTMGIQAAALKQGDRITETYTAPADGILVISVTPGGASDGVLQSGDMILEINGEPVTELEDLKEILYTCRRGDVLQMTVNRFGQPLQLSITLGV
jgi:serine protease Do